MSTGYPQERFSWVPLQLMSLHDVEYSFQVCEMIAFVMDFHNDIVDIAVYNLVYILIKDCIHDTLIGCTSVLQAKGYYCIAVSPKGVLKDVCFSSSRYIFI